MFHVEHGQVRGESDCLLTRFGSLFLPLWMISGY